LDNLPIVPSPVRAVFRYFLPLVLLSGSALGSNPNPQSLIVGKDDLARATRLVGQLGDPVFAAREKAQRELADMGRKALTPLASGAAESPDPEVRLRCRKLIPDARADDFQARIDTFLADTEGKYKHDLPGLDLFFGTAGRNDTARKLFLDLLKSEENRRLLALAEGDKSVLATAVANRAYELYNRQYQRTVVVAANGAQMITTTSAPTTRPTTLDVLTLLIVDTRTIPDKTPRRSVTYSPAYSMQIVQDFRTEAMGNTPTGDVIRTVIGRWLDNRTDPQDLYYGMNFLINANQKEQAVRAAKKLLDLKSATGSYRGMAMTTLARTLGKDAVPHLLPYLSDDSLCVTMRFAAANGGINSAEIQVRDVALASVISATEQKVTDYEFTSRGAGNVISYSTQYFESDEARKKGFKKWAEWAKANPKAVEVKSEKK
jgi:hypothetical protein